jgi:hypothetical protein
MQGVRQDSVRSRTRQRMLPMAKSSVKFRLSNPVNDYMDFIDELDCQEFLVVPGQEGCFST